MADLEGKNLGPYHVQALLGAGGMGQVYRAYDPRLEREVAIKILPATLAQAPGYLERFQREARAIARLSHPNIVSVYDVGEQGGAAYLVMPLIPGGTLRDYLAKRGVLPLNEAVSIIEQVASALQYAHEHGLIHRDVKPANILMSADGRALLSDFGIAKLLDATIALTNTGSSVGSPEYMSPEQARGEADYRSDLYALGVVLFQMLTGQVPFRASAPVQVMLQHVQAAPPAPRSLNPALPPAVEAVILQALAKSPSDRYQSATAFVQALKSAASQPTSATQYGTTAAQAPDFNLPTIAASPGPAAQAGAPPAYGPVSPAVPSPVGSGPAGALPAYGWAPPAGGTVMSPPPPPTFGTGLPPVSPAWPAAPSQPAPTRRRMFPVLFLALALVLIAGGGSVLAVGLSSGWFKSHAAQQAQHTPGVTATATPVPSPTPLPTYYYMARYFVLGSGDLHNGDTTDTPQNLNTQNDYTQREGPNGSLYQKGDALSYGWQFGTTTKGYASSGAFKFVILVDRFDTYQHAHQYFQRNLTLLQGSTSVAVGEEAAEGIVPSGKQQTYQLFFRDRNIAVTIATVPMDNAQGFSDYFRALGQSLDQHGQRCQYDITTLKPLPGAPSDCT